MKPLSIAAAMFVFAACAHQQPVSTAPAPAQPAPAHAAVSPPPPPPAAETVDHKGTDLDALLNGLVIRFGFDAQRRAAVRTPLFWGSKMKWLAQLAADPPARRVRALSGPGPIAERGLAPGA